MIKEIKFTDNALKQIGNLLSKKDKGSFFRIAIKGGGCSGFQYDFSFDNKQEDDDLRHENIIIDKNLYAKNPHFGMDIYAEDFKTKGCVLLENNGIGLKGVPIRCAYYELTLSIKGDSKRHINQHDYDISAHTLQLVVPGDIHSFEYSGTTLEYVLLFEEEFLEKNLEELIFFHKQHPQYTKLDNDQFKRVKELYEQFNLEYKTKKSDYIKFSRSILTQLLYLLKREKLSKSNKEIIQTRSQQITNQFLSLIEQNFQFKKSIQEYADILEITPKYLSEIIKNSLGESALYLIHKRIIKELQYFLCYSNMTIKQIASCMNFKNSSELGRFFKRYEGITPNMYRINNQVIHSLP